MMKLKTLMMTALLAGALAAIGCSDDPAPPAATGGTGGNGTGGTGGNGTAEPCTGGLCDTQDVEIDCDAAVATCIADAELDLTDEQCEAAATELYCNLGTGGAGGMGGNGGNGGMGGTSGELSGCDEDLCATDQARRDKCEEFVPECIVACEGTANPCGEDECIGFALLFICNEQEAQ